AYQGSAEDFAWVVPVPEVPELFLSTDMLFQQLRQRTRPQFRVETVYNGDCEWQWDTGWDVDVSESDTDTDSDSSPSGGVDIIEERNVGPYRTVVLRASSSAALLTWLQDNNYDLPDSLDPVLAPYVASESYFVALGLQNDRDLGDLKPLGMRYAATQPMIPIQLTSIAATPDMRLEVYVLGEERAVPSNYLHVQVNEAAIDWLSWGANYEDIITRAADEAGGQAFATDFSGSTAAFRGMMYTEGRFNTAVFDGVTDPVEAMNLVIDGRFPANGTTLSILRRFLPVPDGLDEQSFYNCVDCYPDQLEGVTVDGTAMGAAFEEEVVAPLRGAEALFSRHSTVSRMTSSISPVEMTVDPMFVFNPDMGDVSNLHTATVEYDCTGGPDIADAERQVVLADGRTILLPPERYFSDNDVTTSEFFEDASVYAAAIVERTAESGSPEVIVDRTVEIDGMIRDNNDTITDLFGRSSCAGCSHAGGSMGGLFGLLVLLGLSRRRR
ncbi:MAG: MYXO-CTERM domain-containing protein, partial [bacterium]